MYIPFKSSTVVVGLLFALLPQGGTAQSEAVEQGIESLFRTAAIHNATLRSCRAAIAEADAAVHSAEAAKLPDISAEASVSYLGNGRMWSRDFDESMSISMPHFGNNFVLRASQLIYAGGAVDAQVRLSEQSAQMARIAAQEEEQRMRFLLVGLYLRLHSLSNSEEIYAANAELAEHLIGKMEQRRKEGVALRNDVTRYELQREQCLLGQTQARDRHLIAAHQLQTALGTDSAITLLPAAAFESALFLADTEARWQERAESEQPSLERSRLSIEMGKSREKLERSALLPHVSIVAEDHFDGPITIEVPTLNKNFNYWFVGLGVRYNLSALYKNNRRVQQARLSTAAATARFDAERQRVNDAVQQAYVNWQTAQSDLKTREKNVQLAVENYDVVSRRYEQGLCLVTDLTDAANLKLSAELALANARIEAVFCHYALRYAAGVL